MRMWSAMRLVANRMNRTFARAFGFAENELPPAADTRLVPSATSSRRHCVSSSGEMRPSRIAITSSADSLSRSCASCSWFVSMRPARASAMMSSAALFATAPFHRSSRDETQPAMFASFVPAWLASATT